ncbi:MAG: HAD family hydrolase [bacterium]
MQIKLVVVDIGGVVFTKGKTLFCEYLSKKYSIPLAKVTAVIDGYHAIQYRCNEITESEYWSTVQAGLPEVKLSSRELEQVWFELYGLIDGMYEIILRLRPHVLVGYLSNNTKERIAYLQNKFGFMEWFDGGVFSYEVGVVKNSNKIYQCLFEKFPGVRPSEIVVIDDKMENLSLPSSLGVNCVHFTTVSNLKQSLRDLGLPV